MKRTTRLISAATVVMAFALLIAGSAWAQAGGNNPCAGLTGKAKGLCVAYSTAMDCSSVDPDATTGACASVATMIEETTGFPPPSDCTCDLSLDRIRGDDNGWDVTDDYTCTKLTNYDSIEQIGKDEKILSSVTPYTGQASIKLSGEFFEIVSFQCGYAGSASGSGEVNDIRFKPITAEDLLSLRVQYDACEGAIATLARNLTIVDSGAKDSCNF